MGTLRCFFLLLAFLFRIGEASHPGPPLIIGTANPSGINGRQESFAALPNGIWSVSETHATESVYRSFKQALGSAADRSRKLRTVHGAFASLRARSQTTGAWTGVMNVSAYPCRQLNVQWRGLEYTSGRALVSQFLVGDHHITGATIYGVPPSSAYNQPLQTTAQILQTITQEVVYGHSGMRFVAGDMNCGPHDLSIFRCWERLGWVEAQLEGFRRWGRALEPTSKGKSVKDQVWLSPELAKYLVSVSNEDDHFPDHSVLYAQLELPGGSAAMANTNTWPLPSPFPWGNFDLQRWTPCSVGTEWDVASSEQAFASWSRQVEASLRSAANAQNFPLTSGHFGRVQQKTPQQRPIQHVPLRSSRHGEVAPASAFLNRALHKWFKQLRRIQSYLHCARRGCQSVEAGLSRALTWQSIMKAPGFQGGFAVWWVGRCIQHQGSPAFLPSLHCS